METIVCLLEKPFVIQDAPSQRGYQNAIGINSMYMYFYHKQIGLQSILFKLIRSYTNKDVCHWLDHITSKPQISESY